MCSEHLSREEIRRLQLRHHRLLCQEMGLPLTGNIICKLLTRRIESRLIPIYQDLINFVGQHDIITVRQFYYHAISTGIVPFPRTAIEGGNTYQRINGVTINARLYGIIPIYSIVDTTDLLGTKQYDNIIEPLIETVDNFRSKWWEEQANYVEVWLEKRALGIIFRSVTNPYGVLLSCAGGYPTLAQVNSLKGRIRDYEDKQIKILYFGDLDPSGKDMPRSLRVKQFRRLGIDASVKEIALTRADVDEYNLPRNPTKPRDTRNEWYIQEYGINYAVELDALPPEVLRQKIRDAIERRIDMDILNRCKEADKEIKEEWRQRIEE